MKTSWLVALAALLIGIGGYAYLKPSPVQAPMTEQQAPETTNAMRAENNAVMVFEQRPGTEVRGTVYLEAPGYLVIHEDNAGSFGAVIGSSALLQAGENRDVTVTLTRPMKDGETLYAMLHVEKGGNATFSASEDAAVESTLGGPIYGIFEATSDASLQIPITL